MALLMITYLQQIDIPESEKLAAARQQRRLTVEEEIGCMRKTKAKLAATVAHLIMSPADIFAGKAGDAGNIAYVFKPNSPIKTA